MPFKFNISEKNGKTYHTESEAEEIFGKSLKDHVKGEAISPELAGYEFEITGASDKAGFPSLEMVEGTSLKKVLLGYGKGMHKRPRREGKKPISNPKPKGLRLRKTIRGKVMSPDIIQINLKVLKSGHKHLHEIFSDQIKAKKEQEVPASV